MSVTPGRNFTRLAVSIIVAAVLVSASVLSYSYFEATTTRTVTTATTTTSTLVSTFTSTATTTLTSTSGTICLSTSNATNAFTTDCQLGVTLGLATSPEFPVGKNVTVSVSLTNDFAESDDINYTNPPSLPDDPDLASCPVAGCPASDYTIPEIFPCGGVIGPASLPVPVLITIDNGSGSPMQLSDSHLIPPSCFAFDLPYYHFGPFQTVAETISVGGYWTSPDANEPWVNATYSQFGPGNYTVVAFDLWGQLASLNFTVS